MEIIVMASCFLLKNACRHIPSHTYISPHILTSFSFTYHTLPIPSRIIQSIQMQIAMEQLTREQQQLAQLNEELKTRAEKFGSSFTPMTLPQFKLFKIKKARETGNIQYLESILLEEIEDLQERKLKIKARMEQFYPELKVQAGDKFFNERETPNFTEEQLQLRPNSWLLFGVDYMSNQLIRHYFHVNPHFRIQWINDSSCNIVFNSPEEAQEAIKPHVKGGAMQDETDIWYQLQEYEVQGVKRRLYCRLSTSKDAKKQESHGHNSQYYRWVINKQKLGSYVKREAYNQIRKTKNINRQDKYHRSSGLEAKKEERERRKEGREKKDEESSSSGVDDSEEKMA